MLEIIEDEQQPFLAQIVEELLLGGGTAVKRKPQRICNRRRQETGIANRGQRHKGAAVCEKVWIMMRHGQRQPGFAHPANANQSQKPAIRIRQSLPNLG